MRKLQFTAAREHEGARLDAVLSALLPEKLGRPISKSKVRQLIVAGAVYLNGSRVRIASKPIRAGARLQAFVDEAKLWGSDETAKDRAFAMTAERILFEDADLIVVDKPPFLPTQPTVDEARLNLFVAVQKFLAERDGRSQPYVGLHHRLDRDTSGLVLFAKSQRANPGIAEAFSTHSIEKTYWAIAETRETLPVEWTVENHLAKKTGGNKNDRRARFGSVRSGGDFARTRFRRLEQYARAALVEARPETGRTHQIRVHLAEKGTPIVGDALYGLPSADFRLMLHARRLTFPHPITKVELSVTSPVPEDFNTCLTQFRNSG